LKWISEIPYTEHHMRISEGRLAGTSEWLFQREEYCNWLASSASKLLLLRGTRKPQLISFTDISSYPANSPINI